MAKSCTFSFISRLLWTSVREAVCLYFSKLQRKQTCPFSPHLLVFSPSFNISNKNIFKNKKQVIHCWFQAKGIMQKVFLSCTSQLQNKARCISQKKRKCVVFSVCRLLLAKKKKKKWRKKIEEHILWKFLSGLDETKWLNSQVSVARSSCNGQPITPIVQLISLHCILIIAESPNKISKID